MARNYKKSDYSRGFKWGKKTIKKAYREEGKLGLHRCDKASRTCSKYGKNRRIKRTKKGKYLNEPLRSYYLGISSGMLAGYNEITSAQIKTKRSNPYDDFDYTSTGRIKGSYVDGRFEPD